MPQTALASAQTAPTPTDWDALDAHKYRDEREAIADLLAHKPLTSEERAAVRAEAEALVRTARRSARKQGVVEGFLQEFSLGTREGLALMCLAEALLRTPDEATRDALIAEKIGPADWAAHLGQSENLFVNASTWGLMLTGKLIDVDEEVKQDAAGFVKRLAGRVGEPVIRAAVAQAIRIMGEQFVLGRTIEDALNALEEGGLPSAPSTCWGRAPAPPPTPNATKPPTPPPSKPWAGGPKRHGPETGHGVSVKLSALSPRYEATQADRGVERSFIRA